MLSSSFSLQFTIGFKRGATKFLFCLLTVRKEFRVKFRFFFCQEIVLSKIFHKTMKRLNFLEVDVWTKNDKKNSSIMCGEKRRQLTRGLARIIPILFRTAGRRWKTILHRLVGTLIVLTQLFFFFVFRENVVVIRAGLFWGNFLSVVAVSWFKLISIFFRFAQYRSDTNFTQQNKKN